MMHAAAVLILMLSVVVLFGALCRLDHLRRGEHKALWILVYFAFAVFALWCAIEAVRALIWHSTSVYVPSALALTGIAAFLIGSRSTWTNGAPNYLNA